MADTKDKLGMAQEWEEVTTPAPAESQPEAKPEIKEFVREIDLGDGSGKQVFKAESYEALADKLAEAHANATRKIQELSRERKKREPEKRSSDWQELKPQPVDPQVFQQPNSADAFRKMFQAEVGLSPEEFRASENNRRRQQAEREAENEFLRRHQDYNPVPENAQKIYRFLQEQNLPVSKHNLDYAFEELRGELKGKTAQPVAETPPPKAEPAPAQGLKVPSPPAFIRPSLGGRGEMEAGGEIDAAEVARIAQLPPAEMKARIEHYFRQSRTSR